MRSNCLKFYANRRDKLKHKFERNFDKYLDVAAAVVDTLSGNKNR